MAECTFRDGTVISDYGRPYIVAEVNSSHRGDMNVARQMIDAAVDIGCDCVKFQSWAVESLYSKTYYDANPIAKRFVKKFAVTPENLKDLAGYCRSRGIAFSSTPYSEEEVDFLVSECDVPYIKIASMELNYPKFLKYIGEKQVPVVLSTGMSTMNEIEDAVSVLHQVGVSQMVLLHCVSIYPTVLTTVNLNNILGLREKFGDQHPIGFSDHTEGDAAAVAAVALGAGLIEKHLTLDREKVGIDNGIATEPAEFKALVNKCRDIQIALGSKERSLTQEELDQRKNMRRSIIAVRDIYVGEIINEADLSAKRPGTGFAPNQIDEVVGKKTVRDIKADTVVLPEDIENSNC